MSEVYNRENFPLDENGIRHSVDLLVAQSHQASATCGWWHDPVTGVKRAPDVPRLLMLCVSELSEAMEGHRRNLADDKLPHRRMFEVELADCLLRICDMAGALDLDLGGAVAEKLLFNLTRDDHKPAARAAAGGKAY